MPQWPIRRIRSVSIEAEATPPEAPKPVCRLVIGHSMRFRGDLEVDSDLSIEGSVKGSISAKQYDIIIEEFGVAEANVHAGSVTVRGSVRGAIIASGTVKLEASARVDGPIHAARVVLEEGCHLAGRIDVDTGAVVTREPTQPLFAGRRVDRDRIRLMNDSPRSAHD